MAILILFGTPLYLVLQGEMEIGMRVASGVVLLALLAVFVYSGRKPIPNVTKIPKVTEEIEEEIATPIIETETVTEQNDESIKRSRGKVAAPAVPTSPTPMPPPGSPMPPPMPMPPTGIPAPAIMEEGGNVAKRLVIDRDAQTEMEAEVESFVKERREKRSEIRDRIQRRRRMELAERRAAKVRMWTELEDGEDLGKTLSTPNHGLEVINEPENPDESVPLGVSYVRIDENRILKLKIPLNVETSKVEEISPEMPIPPNLPPPIPTNGELPPPPGPPGMPPPPPPPPQ